MPYTDDPVSDFLDWDRKQEEKRERLPRCHCCKEPIQQEDAVLLGDEWYCDECLKDARTRIEVDW